MGVVVRRYIDSLIIIINLYSICISSFLGGNIPTSCSFLKCFSFLFMLFLCNIANVLKEHSRSFKIRDHANMAI